jgi:hypothetical protein
MEPIEAIEKMTKEEQAEIAAYRHPETEELYVPGEALARALINGASYVKGKGRASMIKPTAACVRIDPLYLLLGTDEYGIDSRPVRNPSTKGTVVRHRPRLDKWKISFDLEYDRTLISAAQMREIIDNTGSRVGLLDFRPERKGPFGRFVVTEWKSDER